MSEVQVSAVEKMRRLLAIRQTREFPPTGGDALRLAQHQCDRVYHQLRRPRGMMLAYVRHLGS